MNGQGMEVSRGVDPSTNVIDAISEAARELSLVLMGAEAAQPLPDGWYYKRETSSQFVGDSYQLTVTSVPTRMSAPFAENPIALIPSQAPSLRWL